MSGITAYASNNGLPHEGTINPMEGVFVVANTTPRNFQLPTANFPAGVYVLRLISGDNVKTQKVVVR